MSENAPKEHLRHVKTIKTLLRQAKASEFIADEGGELRDLQKPRVCWKQSKTQWQENVLS